LEVLSSFDYRVVLCIIVRVCFGIKFSLDLTLLKRLKHFLFRLIKSKIYQKSTNGKQLI